MAFSRRGTTILIAFLGLALAILAGSVSGSTAAGSDPVLPESMGADPAGEFAPPATRSSSRGATTSSARRGGGITIPANPRIDNAYCVKQCVSTRKATPGAVVRITGAYLGSVQRVVFPGKNGNMRVKLRARRDHAVRAVVPKGADDGYPYVVDSTGTRSNRSPKELLIEPKSKIPREVFPVRGPFSYGGSGGRFGAGRPGHTHQGQDLSAACGTELVAVKRARVVYAEYHSAAGNYVVLKNWGENTYFAYMHMIRPSPLKVGDKVGAGQLVGKVGTTGTSSGCHLHFEYWIGPWQTGGKPINPLPYLRSLQ